MARFKSVSGPLASNSKANATRSVALRSSHEVKVQRCCALFSPCATELLMCVMHQMPDAEDNMEASPVGFVAKGLEG